MNKIFIVSLLGVSFLSSASLSPDEITKMIAKIKKERVGISLSKLERTENPFVIVEFKSEENLTKEKEEEVIVVAPIVQPIIVVEPTYTLGAILNHSAFINKKWYKRGSKIAQYSVVHIGTKSVTLKSADKKKVLYLKKKKHIKLH